jgi:hypothetical protein
MKPIDLYRQQIHQIPKPGDKWFATALAEYRARRDDDSLREICGRSLRQTLAEADEFCRYHTEINLLDAVQEANAALVAAVKSFSGGSLAEFRGFLHEQAQARLYHFLFSNGHNEQENA